MKVKLTRIKNQQYEVQNEDGLTIPLGNKPDGFSPMEAVLAAAAACSSIDIEIILGKMKAGLESIEVEVEGLREEDATPKVFTHINLHYKLYGTVKHEKAEKAIKLSVEKYCTVLKMLEKSVEIGFTFQTFNNLKR